MAVPADIRAVPRPKIPSLTTAVVKVRNVMQSGKDRPPNMLPVTIRKLVLYEGLFLAYAIAAV